MSGSLATNRPFLRLWIGQAASFVGDAVAMVALVVLIVQTTGSAAAVGGALVARLLPTLASPLLGVMADRLDRRAVLVASDLARALFAVGLIFTRDVAVIYGLIFLSGTARALFNPTVRAAFPSVVGESDLTRANSIVSGTFSVSITLGPALGGLLVAGVGVDVAFAIDAATFLLSAILLSRVPLPRPEVESEEGFFSELRFGLGYLAGARVPLAMVAGAFLTVLATDLATPAEIFLAKRTFGTGDLGYGLLVAVWGSGMVVGSAVLGVLGERVRLLPVYFLGLLAWSLALVGAGLSPTFVLALGALAIAGVANGTDNVATDTILQKAVPDALLGRVFAVRFAGYGAAEALAFTSGGLIVDGLGPRFAYAIAGLATAGAGALILLLVMPALLSRSNPSPEARPTDAGD